MTLFIVSIVTLLSITENAYCKPSFSCHSTSTTKQVKSRQVLTISCNVANAFVGHTHPMGIINLVPTTSKTASFNIGVNKRIKYRRGIKSEETGLVVIQLEKNIRIVEAFDPSTGLFVSYSNRNIADSLQLRC